MRDGDGRAQPAPPVDPVVSRDVYEVKLGDEYLMSSLFTVAEEELARLGLAALGDGPGGQNRHWDVLVGGLGLGYTARAVLEDSRVRSMHVVEAADAVISWHERGLLPLVRGLTADPRTRLVLGDFFALAASTAARSRPVPTSRPLLSAILVDIDHTPGHLLASLARRLLPAGGPGAAGRPSAPRRGVRPLVGRRARPGFRGRARPRCSPRPARTWSSFPNPLTGGTSANSVYTAVHAR